jgi:GNAT superfamily N-acetyltransferase
MLANTTIDDSITLQDAPAIEGLRFRHFHGEADYPAMIEVLEASRSADGLDEISTVENLARAYSDLRNCDPQQDMVMVEVDGRLVGYNRVDWYKELDGTHIYNNFGFLMPDWRGKGIGTALIRHVENRLREIAAGHPQEGDKQFATWTSMTQTAHIGLIEREGYAPVRYSYSMVRPDLENIPDCPLPEGMEVRPVTPEQHRTIWEAEVEAFKDHWGEWQTEEGDYDRWLKEPMLQPEIWQVAWEGDQVVGMVRNFINREENEKFGRLRGYTENISVRKAWRKRGVARALIANSFRLLKDLGMKEAALGVDALNPNGALQLYEKMGFKVDKEWKTYRKPLR